MFGSKTQALQQRAQKVLPLGVNSNFRFWGDGITPYVDKTKGGYLWDVDGKKYIDLTSGIHGNFIELPPGDIL